MSKVFFNERFYKLSCEINVEDIAKLAHYPYSTQEEKAEFEAAISRRDWDFINISLYNVSLTEKPIYNLSPKTSQERSNDIAKAFSDSLAKRK